MIYEPKTIYRRGNAHILVLSTSSAGMHMVYVGNRDILYGQFPELKIDDIGYVEFGKIFFVRWKELNRRIETSVYKKMTDRQYNTVIATISSMFTGNIIKYDGAFMYADEALAEKIDEVAPVLPAETLDDKGISNDAYARGVTMEEEVKPDVADSEKEHPVIIDDLNPEVSDGARSTNNEENSAPAVDDMQHETGIDNVNHLIVKVDDGSIMYDLLYVQNNNRSTNGSDSKYPAKRRRKNADNSQTRRYFTKDEALGIAASTVSAIVSKYGLNSSHAALVRRNARKLFDFEIKEHNMRSIKKTIDECTSVEEAAAKLNIPVYRVLSYKAHYAVNESATQDGNDKLRTYVNGIIESRDYDNMHEFFTTNNHDISAQFNATISAVYNECTRVYHELALNPLYPVFGIDAFRTDLEDYLKSMRASGKSIILTDIYKKIMELWNVYYRTINIHSKFLNGIDDPRKYVSEENMDYFMSMIWNRFNRKRIIDSRLFSATQKAAIKNNDLYQFCTRFLVEPGAGRSSLCTFRKNKLKAKEDKK